MITNARVDEILSWPVDESGWRHSPDTGDWVTLGDWVRLGNGVTLGDGVASDQLAADFRAAYDPAKRYILWKWVTPERKSPDWDGGTVLDYPDGAVLEAPEAEYSDQQCAPGLHVFRPGYRPEYDGYGVGDYVCLEVMVYGRDICFAGLPGWDAKLRVRKLKVIGERGS